MASSVLPLPLLQRAGINLLRHVFPYLVDLAAHLRVDFHIFFIFRDEDMILLQRHIFIGGIEIRLKQCFVCAHLISSVIHAR